MKVVACLMASHPVRDESIAENVYRALDIGLVDGVVFVNGSERHRFEIEEWEGVHTVHRLWDDDFPKQRNQYLREVDRLQDDWQDDVLICTFDDDEVYSDVLWKRVRQIGDQALEQDRNQLAIRCHSITLNLEGKRIQEHLDDYFKGLILVGEPGIKYLSSVPDRITPSETSFVHEFLIIPTGTRYTQINDSTIFYEHIKMAGDVWFRAARNVWAGGGGPNIGDTNPWWKPFRRLVQSVAPRVQTSIDWENYLKAGNIHPKIKEEILSFRHIGTPYDLRKDLWPTFPDGCSEWREISQYYFIVARPDELPPEIIEADRGKIDWEGEIQRIHGLVYAKK